LRDVRKKIKKSLYCICQCFYRSNVNSSWEEVSRNTKTTGLPNLVLQDLDEPGTPLSQLLRDVIIRVRVVAGGSRMQFFGQSSPEFLVLSSERRILLFGGIRVMLTHAHHRAQTFLEMPQILSLTIQTSVL